MSYIVVLGAERWRAQATRTQCLLSWLAQKHQILFFQPSPVRFSRSPYKSEYKKPCRKPLANVRVYTLPPSFDLRNQDHPRMLEMNRSSLVKYVREKCQKHHFRNYLLWLCSPVYAPLLDDLGSQGMVYDCYQDWAQFDIRWESLIANRADLLFAASPGLVDHLSPCNTNIGLLPNGGDARLFQKAHDLTVRTPTRLLPYNGPMLGYLGDVGRKTDLRPVYLAAKAHSHWHFFFAGRCSAANPSASLLSGMRNVHFLGKIHRRDLPEYAASFHVLFNLLDTRDPDEDVIPSRIYEYLTTGKPIVTMYPENYSPLYSDLIYGARSGKEFVSACEQALLEKSSYATRQRMIRGEQADWPLRGEQAEQMLRRNSLL